MGITRRELLTRIGQVGGYSAAFATMQSLGLIAMKGEQLEPIKAAPGMGKGIKVAVLGGGIGGRGWRGVKWNEGSWVRSYGNGLDGYNTLIEAAGPIYFAGDSVSKIPR